ncbi:MAG: MarR family winged helix-turn-helix transcriptional regulator [Thermodesulfobacteriota bacterium]
MPASHDADILDSLRHISRALDILSRSLAARCRLTAPQLICLRALIDEPALTPGQLARRMALSQATVAGILDRLEDRGLVERRRVLLYATAAGRRLAGGLVRLQPQEREPIAAVLRQVAGMMEEAAPA